MSHTGLSLDYDRFALYRARRSLGLKLALFRLMLLSFRRGCLAGFF